MATPFRTHGWLKPPTDRSHKSRLPDILAPINLAFRLRQVLGIGARSEVVRFLLTIEAPSLTTQVIAESAGYSKRNVHEALAALHAARVIDAVTVGNQQRYRIGSERWAALLGLEPDELPFHRAWPQLFAALRRLSRWLGESDHESKSDYMLASDARVLADEITRSCDTRACGSTRRLTRAPITGRTL